MGRLNLSGKDASEICEILHEKCKHHDWFFTMSDDTNAYYKGLAKADEIDYIRNVLDGMGFGMTAKTIIEGWKPKTKIGH